MRVSHGKRALVLPSPGFFMIFAFTADDVSLLRLAALVARFRLSPREMGRDT